MDVGGDGGRIGGEWVGCPFGIVGEPYQSYPTTRAWHFYSHRSWEIFGDKVDRIVDFKDGDLAAFAGKPVTLEFDMSDADIYSFWFK